MSEIISATTSAATSSTFTVSSPVSLQVTSLSQQEFCQLQFQYNSSGGWFPCTSIGNEGRITMEMQPVLIAGPGTYRLLKPVTGNAVAAAVESQ